MNTTIRIQRPKKTIKMIMRERGTATDRDIESTTTNKKKNNSRSSRSTLHIIYLYAFISFGLFVPSSCYSLCFAHDENSVFSAICFNQTQNLNIQFGCRVLVCNGICSPIPKSLGKIISNDERSKMKKKKEKQQQ